MPARALGMLHLRSRGQWPHWLEGHHASALEIWLAFHGRAGGTRSPGYDAAVEEALCYGWVGSLVRRVDESRYAREFTPRKADSKWSTANRKRYADLVRRCFWLPAGGSV
jgi:uncharacterized protein YdeI (YjbR/CyaY-like superfamily)